MRVGLSVPKLLPDDPSRIAGAVARAVQNITATGFSHVWIPDVLNRGYMTLDPLTYAAVIAATNPGLEVGTAVLQVGRHGPVDLAHRVLTSVALSDGRFTLGVGTGSTRADFDAVGASFAERSHRLETNLEVIRVLLSGGEHSGVRLVPEGQSMMPSIVIGAWRSHAWIERAAVEFDGWMGSTAKTSISTLRQGLATYRAAGGDRAIAGNVYVDLTDVGAAIDDDDPFDLRCNPSEASVRLRRLADLGFDEVTLTLFDHDVRTLETLQELASGLAESSRT